MHAAGLQLKKALEVMNQDHVLLQSELLALHAVGRSREGVMQIFLKRVYTAYSGKRRTQTERYRNGLNAVLANAK